MYNEEDRAKGMSVNDMLQSYQNRRNSQLKGFAVIGSLIAVVFLVIGIIVSSNIDTYIFSFQSKDPRIVKLNQIYELMNSKWYFRDDVETEYTEMKDYFIDNAIIGMLNNEVDPFSHYVPAPVNTGNLTCGIGILMDRYDGFVLVNSVYPDSSADNAGIIEDDLITHVNSTDISQLKNLEIQAMVKGECNTTVNLTVKRGSETLPLELTRTRFDAKSVLLEEATSDYIHVRLLEFSNIADSLFSAIINEYKDDLPDNLIIDLRDNGGGDLRSTVNIASMLLDDGKTVTSLKNRENEVVDLEKVNTNLTKYDFENIYILINHNSASASEMLTLALYENMKDKVKVVGTSSYGKGTAQRVMTFADGSEFRYTYAKWYSPDNNNIHDVGITPQLPLPSTYTEQFKELTYDVFTTYSKTDSAQSILNAKVLLNELGYNLEISTYFDETLRLALLDYQEDEGLPLSGELDIKTSNRLHTMIIDAKRTEMDMQLDYVIAQAS